MDPMVTSAIISGGAQVGSQLGQYMGGRKQRRLQRQLASGAQQHNIDMWKMQAEYNAPKQQMQRMIDAGLNPNLMYGSSPAQASGTMSQAPEPVVPPVENIMANFQIPNLIELYKAMHQAGQAKSERESASHREYADRLLPAKAEYETDLKMFQSDKAYHDMKVRRRALEDIVAQYKYKAEHAKNQAEKEYWLAKLSEVEYEMQSVLKEYGVSMADPMTIRVLLKIFEIMGIDMKGALKQF